MYDPLSLIKLPRVMKRSDGDRKIVVGIIDGPMNLGHPAFKGSEIIQLMIFRLHFATMPVVWSIYMGLSPWEY